MSEVSQTEGKISYDIPYMQNIKISATKELDLQNRRLTNLENELMAAGGSNHMWGKG